MRTKVVRYGSFAVVFACFILLWTSTNAQEKSELTAQQALLRLKAGNDRFAADKLEKIDLGAKKRRELAKEQHPFAVILTCADSRVPPEYLFNQGLGDLFDLRVAGNIADPFVLGSIEYAVEHLHVHLIVVLGHDNCGAVEEAFRTAHHTGNLGKLLDEIYVGKNLPKDRKTALALGIRNNVRHHAGLLASRSEIIKKHVEGKDVEIVSGIYCFSTGKVEWLNGK